MLYQTKDLLNSIYLFAKVCGKELIQIFFVDSLAIMNRNSMQIIEISTVTQINDRNG
jgi:hypothetical protein